MATAALRLSMLLRVLRAGTNRSLRYRRLVLCCRGIKRPAATVFNHVFEYSIPGLWPRDCERTAEQNWHRIGQPRWNFLASHRWVVKVCDDCVLTDFRGGWLSSIFVPVGREAPAACAGSGADGRLRFPAARRALPFASRRCRTPVVISALSDRSIVPHNEKKAV